MRQVSSRLYCWQRQSLETDHRIDLDVFVDKLEQFAVHQDACTTHDGVAAAIVKGIEKGVGIHYAVSDANKLRDAVSEAFKSLLQGEETWGTRKFNTDKYQYSVMFAEPNTIDPDEFQAVFTSINFTARITESKGWLWGTSREGNMSASVTAFKVVSGINQSLPPRPK